MFDSLVANIELVVADVQAGDYGKAFNDFLPIAQDAAPFVIGLFTGKKTAYLSEDCDKLNAACDKAITVCQHELAKKEGIFPGDGSFAKAFIAFLMQLLVVLGPIIKPAPAPAA